ncbi:hypothetical protein GCM10008938_48790 [Deinococcus roseus]|uniref:Transposase n=1 Tax=Deinococcus roseus TaxID=392414 RepID=A0ABQ2DHK9_9DEIO|nr:hypothetical protein GCM10008938_48790 [Deinococcus roseus]
MGKLTRVVLRGERSRKGPDLPDKEQFLQAGLGALSGNKNETPSAALQNENDRLKRLLAEKELELDIAKKARGR